MPGSAHLPVGGMAPLRQGDLDSLCGLYAAINAIRLALAKTRLLTSRELRQSFGRGVALLSVRHQLTCSLLVGCEAHDWPALVDAVTGQAARMTGVPLICARPLSQTEQPGLPNVFGVIEDAIGRGQPVLVTLGGWYDHHTVISGYSAFSLQLFDSANLRRLARGSCRVDDDMARGRHILRPRSLTVLALA